MKRFYSIFLIICLLLSISACSMSNDDKEIIKTEVLNETINNSSNISNGEHKLENDENVLTPHKLMRVHYLDVGQADCTFIELGNGQTMLIDAGEPHNSDSIIQYIRDLQYSSIDYVIATHPHEDHIGGMAEVLKAFEIGEMYMPRQVHTISAFENMVDTIQSEKITLHTARAGVRITPTDLITIDMLAPIADSYSNLNNCSAIVKITYGETKFLFMGDAEQEIELQLLDSDIDADVLKVGHHGSNTSSADSFIKEVSPEFAVISSGGEYGHPHSDTIAILSQVDADIYRTDEDGTILVVADHNKNVKIEKKSSKIKENAPPIETEETSKVDSEDYSSENIVVYRTRTGSKYHRGGCSYLKSKIKTTVSEAQAMGLGPCSRCTPPR